VSGSESLQPAYFDALYAADPDPWRFVSSEYEREKYDSTLATLPHAAFGAAFEVGCSIGVLTRRLSDRCNALLAVDVAELALEQARTRCAGLRHVRFERRRVPQEWPPGEFDLILFSEVLYYLSADDIAATAALARGSLVPGGTVLLAHYTLPTNYPFSGDAACEMFIGAVGLSPNLQRRAASYRLDRLG
jgi:predicted TPR repeat methyltransferase